MRVLYLVSVWLHILSATAWIGGMIFLVAVVVPLLRSPLLKERATELLLVSGRRFRTVAWFALGTLVATGVFNVLYRGYSFGQFFTGEVFEGSWGRTLAYKLALVTVILVISAIHDFYIGIAATTDPDLGRREKFRRAASLIGRANFLLALVVVALAVTLVRG